MSKDRWPIHHCSVDANSWNFRSLTASKQQISQIKLYLSTVSKNRWPRHARSTHILLAFRTSPSLTSARTAQSLNELRENWHHQRIWRSCVKWKGNQANQIFSTQTPKGANQKPKNQINWMRIRVRSNASKLDTRKQTHRYHRPAKKSDWEMGENKPRLALSGVLDELVEGKAKGQNAERRRRGRSELSGREASYKPQETHESAHSKHINTSRKTQLSQMKNDYEHHQEQSQVITKLMENR